MSIEIGDTFGRWTVLSHKGVMGKNRSLHYECKCECGCMYSDDILRGLL
jgi:hypothetical protein